MMELTPKDVLERFNNAKQKRGIWENHWQECYDFALPHRSGFFNEGMGGEKRADKLFDGTAPDAVDQLAASLLAHLTPPWARWFGLTPGPEVQDETNDALSKELEKASNALQTHFERSNFSVEMMLRPVNIADSRLDPDLIGCYDEELDYREHNQQASLYLGEKRLVSSTCWWDPSYGSPDRGDASVIAALYTDEDGQYWLHRLKYLTHDPNKLSEADEATQQCRQVVDFVKDLYLPSLSLETNGVGKFLPGLLRRELEAAGVSCAVIEKHSRTNKVERILSAFDVVLASRGLKAHRNVWQSRFITEMREWVPQSNNRDDALDAVSGCLLSEPVRLPRKPLANLDGKSLSHWGGADGSCQAQSDFEV